MTVIGNEVISKCVEGISVEAGRKVLRGFALFAVVKLPLSLCDPVVRLG